MSMILFLHFPGEIRNQIYSHLLIVPSSLSTSTVSDAALYPAILSSCKTIYQEARQILYGHNTFEAHPNRLSSLPRLRADDKYISSPELISLIRRFHIKVRLDCDANFCEEKAREAFSGLEEFTIDVFQAQFGSCDYNVLKLFEGVRGVRKSRIRGSVQAFLEYVRWLQDAMGSPMGTEVDRFNKDRVARVINNSTRKYDIWTDNLSPKNYTYPLFMESLVNTEKVSSTFNSLPVEIKGDIFRLLLINPVLAFASSISPSLCENELRVKYDLSPEILRVCRKWYKAGMEILYGENTFLLECLYNNENWEGVYNTNQWPASPLTRHLRDMSYTPSEGFPTLVDLPAVKFVLRWKIIVSAVTPYPTFRRDQPSPTLTSLCQVSRHNRLKSLTILVAPRHVLSYSTEDDFDSYQPMFFVLSPFCVFRNVGKIKFGDAMPADIPWCYNLDYPSDIQDIISLRDFVAEQDLASLITGNSPVIDEKGGNKASNIHRCSLKEGTS